MKGSSRPALLPCFLVVLISHLFTTFAQEALVDLNILYPKMGHEFPLESTVQIEIMGRGLPTVAGGDDYCQLLLNGRILANVTFNHGNPEQKQFVVVQGLLAGTIFLLDFAPVGSF